MVKIGKLWGNARFASLPPKSKLLYLYLVTHSSISTLGVLEVNSMRVVLDIGFRDKEEYSQAVSDLSSGEYLVHIKDEEFGIFIIKEHFLSLSKSKLNIRKAVDEGKSSPYRTQLLEIYTQDDFKPPLSFTPPTPKEVVDHALTLGYVVNGNTFCEYYSERDWYNKNNKKLRSWKLTLEKVWCRDENKLVMVEGSPVGYEYFHVTLENGERLSPEGWKNGMPTHSNFMHEELLVNGFN